MQNLCAWLSARVAVCVLALLSAFTPHSAAATFNIEGSKVQLVGTVQTGDAERFLQFMLSSDPGIGELILDSPGGAVEESLRIAAVIEALRLNTEVKYEGLCASSCFMMWHAGSFRYAYFGSSRVGLHRPYYKAAPGPDGDIALDAGSLRQAMTRVRGHLVEHNVPQRLIEIMMSRPSNQIYWLTGADFRDLGTRSPENQELLVANCADKHSRRAEKAGDADLAQIVCEMGLMGRMRDKEHLALIDKVRGGWRPWTNGDKPPKASK
jgi:hypothetical protein